MRRAATGPDRLPSAPTREPSRRGGHLRLEDGQAWSLESADDSGRELVCRLALHMGLGFTPRGKGEPASLSLRVRCSGRLPDFSQPLAPGVCISSPRRKRKGLVCRVDPFSDEESLVSRLMSLAYVFSRGAEARGGLLVHGALVARGGYGAILSGKSGVGKSTAAGRIAAPWRALSDDAALIVRAHDGAYWAHPWPTWSRIFEGETHRSWPVATGVRLAGIFFLSQTSSRNLTPIPRAQASVELLGRSYDCSWDVFRPQSRENVRKIRLELFQNACRIGQSIPCYTLRVTLRNAFWRSMEQVMATCQASRK